jgi:ribosomal protein S18 acetylase RimI-like enzyme
MDTGLLDNCRAYWLSWAPPGDRQDDGLTIFRSGLEDPQLNGVLRSRGMDPAAALAIARERLAGVPWLWWDGPDSTPGAAPDAEVAFTVPIMAVEIDRVTTSADAPAVTEARDVTEWTAAYAPSFHIPPEAVAAVAEREAAMTELVRFEVRRDDRIVGTSALLAHAGVAGVYTVTVAEAYRRRGIGTAVTAAALAAGRARGLTVGTLQATSSAGRRVYERMGFRTVGTYRMLRP